VSRARPRDQVLTAVALLALLTSFRSVVDGRTWWVPAALVVGLLTLALVVLRQIGLGRLVPVLALTLELGLLAWVFDTTDLWDLATSATAVIMDEQAPVAATPPIEFTVAAAFGALAILTDVLVHSRWAVAGVGAVLVVVYATPPMITGGDASPWLFVVVAALWLALVRSRSASDTVTGRRTPTLVIGAAGLAAALAAPAVLPDISAVAARWGNAPPQVFGSGINPMIELGANLRRNSSATVLTLTTELNRAPYLKVATLTDFTGRTWRPVERDRFARTEGMRDVADGIDVEEKTTTIRIASLRSDRLPVPYPATTVDGLRTNVSWERTGRTATVPSASLTGETYTVASLVITPTADQLRAMPEAIPPSLVPMTQLEVPPTSREAYQQIRRAARDVTAGQRTRYDQVKALQDHLRTSGGFTYSELAPVSEDYDGNGLDVVAQFLTKKSGYCVHFSSAMAVMARSLGIPARIAVGYAPGERTGFDGVKPIYTVRSDDLHAWTEIWFDGAGWVRFDPTTSIGSATAFAEPSTAGPVGPEDANAADPTPQDADDVGEKQSQAQASETAPDESAGRTALAASAAALLLLGVPWVWRSSRRRSRLRSGSIERLWREVEDTAIDLGHPASSTGTVRGFAGTLPVDPEPLERLLTAVERNRYSRQPDDVTDSGDAERVVADLFARADRSQRLRARVAPRSLVGRSGRGGAVAERAAAETLASVGGQPA